MSPRVHALSVPGALHLARGQPCQDAAGAWSGPGWAVLVVADGHGAALHPRSAEGSALAVAVARELLCALAQELCADPAEARVVEARLAAHLPRRLCWSWNVAVRRHTRRPEHGAWAEDLTAFGTTLIGVVLTEALALAVQIGDGGVLLLDGDRPVRPLPEDPELGGGRTWSLALPEAWRNARLRCAPRQPGLWLACTDGVSPTAEDPDLERLGLALRGELGRQGWEGTVAGLPGLLAEWSRRGNGDDASLALCWEEPA